MARHAQLADYWERRYRHWDSVTQRIEAVELARVQAERAANPRTVAGLVTPEWYDLQAALRTHAEYQMASRRRDSARVKAEHYAALALIEAAAGGVVSWPTPSDAYPSSTRGR